MNFDINQLKCPNCNTLITFSEVKTLVFNFTRCECKRFGYHTKEYDRLLQKLVPIIKIVYIDTGLLNIWFDFTNEKFTVRPMNNDMAMYKFKTNEYNLDINCNEEFIYKTIKRLQKITLMLE